MKGDLPSEHLPIPEESGKAISSLPAILDAATFVMQPFPEPKQIVHGVLHQGSKLALGGGSKSFKTWTLLDLALSVAYGKPWLSFRTTAARVLFVNFEIQDFSWQRRIQAVANAKEIIGKPEKLFLLNLRGLAAHYNMLIPQIQTHAKAQNFGLIILDPVYKLYGDVDENSAGDIAGLLNAFESLAVQTGAAIAFGCHFSKGNQAGKESIDRISGSGVFARDPDSLLMMTPHQTEGAFTIEATLRDFPQVEPFVVSWKFPFMRPDAELDPAKLKRPRGGRLKAHDPKKLLGAIATSTKEKPVSISAWAKAVNVSRTTLNDYLTEMRLKGWIATAGEGNAARQYITENGLESIKGANMNVSCA